MFVFFKNIINETPPARIRLFRDLYLSSYMHSCSKGHEDRKGDRKWIMDINIQREGIQSVTLHKGLS